MVMSPNPCPEFPSRPKIQWHATGFSAHGTPETPLRSEDVEVGLPAMGSSVFSLPSPNCYIT